MTRTTGNGESGSYSSINMTPLIDVMLVLLIIFIITIPRQTHAVKIDNPTGKAPETQDHPGVIDLAIDFDGLLTWNGRPVDRVTLLAYAGQAAAAPVQPEIHLSVDRSARYEAVAQALADVQRQGLRKIGFLNDGM